MYNEMNVSKTEFCSLDLKTRPGTNAQHFAKIAERTTRDYNEEKEPIFFR